MLSDNEADFGAGRTGSGQQQILQLEDLRARKKQKYFSGRNVSLRFLAVCILLIFALNLGFYIFTLLNVRAEDGTLLVATDECSKIKYLDIGLHAIMNVLGILALAAVGA